LRFLDIAVAAVIGLVSTTAIVAWSPTPYASTSHSYQVEIGLRDLLVKIVEDEGVVGIQRSSFSEICSIAARYTNSSVTVSAEMGGNDCVAGPPSGSIGSTLEIPLYTGQVILEAWETEGP
jgi:hypothetical protein